MIPLQLATSFWNTVGSLATGVVASIVALFGGAEVANRSYRRARRVDEAKLATQLRSVRFRIGSGGAFEMSFGGSAGPDASSDETEAALGHLRSAGHALERLEAEIKERGESVRELREQQTVLALTPEQIESLQAIFRKDMERSGRKQVLIGFALGAFWFGVGVGVTLLFGW